MVRTKIKVNVAVLQQRTKSMNIIIGSGTTAHNVVCKVLEKCNSKDPPNRFQLWAVTGGSRSQTVEHLLEDEGTLARMIAQGGSQSIQFHLKYKPRPPPPTTGLIRVYHQIDQDFETFQSLIVTPNMTTKDVMQLALARISLEESHDQFELIQKTPSGEYVVKEEEHPMLLAKKDTQLTLRRRVPKQVPRRVTSIDTTKPSVTALQHSKPPPLVDAFKHNFSSDSEPLTIISTSSEVDGSPSPISDVHLGKGKMQLHSELIESLRNLASQLESRPDSGEKAVRMNREKILEQAVVEQSQILDVMQGLISSLETENKSFREKISDQSRTILELASWEAKAKKAERHLSELTSGKDPSLSASEYKRALAERDKQIATLQAQPQSAVSANTRLFAAQANLESERIRVIELEEELSAKREELIKLKEELSSKQSVLLTKESEVMHLRHEMKTMKKLEAQQQEVVLRQRTALTDKDTQLISLTRALSDEKKLCEQLRKRQLHLGSSASFLNSKVGDSSRNQKLTQEASPLTSSLFDQVLGRYILAVEVTKLTADTELGFSFSKMDLPVSTKAPCLIVKAVKQGSIAFGLIKPGDEILEINGVSCRGPHQSRATDYLQSSVGTIKVVLARDQEPSFDVPFHSTPRKPKHEGEPDSTLWATAVPGDDNTVYKSFSATLSTLPLSESTTDKYVSVPTSHQSFTLSTSNTAVSQNESPSTSNEAISKLDTHSTTDSEMTACKSLQLEYADLQDQLDDSEHSRLELETELDECRSEMESIQMECDLTKAENFELQQQISSYEGEVAQIQSNIVDMQSVLINLETQVTDEHQRAASYENQNRLLTRELEESKELYKNARSEVTALQEEVQKLRLVSSEKELAEQQRLEELDRLNSLKDQLQEAVATKEARVEELSAVLSKKATEYESSLSQMKEEMSNLEGEVSSLKKASSEATSSAETEYTKTLSQLKSAKSLLMEAEMRESEMKIQMRYLKQAADQANQQLAEAEGKTKGLEAEVSSYKGEVENLTLNNKSLSLGLKHTQGKLEAKEKMLPRLQNEVDNLRRNTAKLNNEASQIKAERSKLLSSLKAAESEQERLEEKLRSSNAEKDSLFQDLENSIDECTQLQQKVEDMDRLSVEVETLRSKEKQLKTQVSELLEQRAADKEEVDKKIEHIRAEKKAVEEELIRERSGGMQKTQTASLAQEEVSHLQRDLQHQKEVLSANEEEKVQLAQQNEILKKKNIEQRDSFDKLTQSNVALNEELDSVKTSSQEMRRELESCQKKVEILKQQCSSYKEECKTLESSLQVAQRELNESRADHGSLLVAQEEFEQSTKNLQEAESKLRIEVSQKNQALSELKGTYAQLEEELMTEKEISEGAKAEMASLQNEVSGLRRAKKQSEDMVSSMEFILKQEQDKVQDTQASLKSKEDEVRRLNEQVSDLASQLVATKAEKEAAEEKLSALRLQFQENEENKNHEVSVLKKQIETLNSDLSELRDELQAAEARSNKHEILSSQHQATVEHANNERYKVQKNLDEALKERGEIGIENKQLTRQVAKLKSDIERLEETSNALSSEAASLRQLLRQSEREIDKLSAQVQAAEINLEVANRTLVTEQKHVSEYTEAVDYLQSQLKETQQKLEDAKFKVQRGGLELHASEEEKSQLKTNLSLRQKECSQLQQSLLEAQSSVSSFKKRVKSLETENKDLSQTVDQLQECHKEIQSSIEASEKEHTEHLKSERETVSRLSAETEELREKEKSYLGEIKKLERSLEETRSTVEQLLAAQEALKKSLGALGDEKDVEILRLTKELSEFKSSHEEAAIEVSKLKTKEESIQAQLRDSEKVAESREERIGELVKENHRLSEELSVLKSTEAEITELHSKIGILEERLRTKSSKLAEVTQQAGDLQTELSSAQAALDEHQTNVSELAKIKLELVVKSTESDELKNRVATESKTRKELESERDQLLTVLRKLEVEKHTTAVQPPTPQLPRSEEGVDKEKVISLLKDKEEEAQRLREYVGKLLSAVVEKAPFVLENMTLS